METRPNRSAQKFTVAVIGGGFTGTTLAAQLVRHSNPSFSVVVIENLARRDVAWPTALSATLIS